MYLDSQKKIVATIEARMTSTRLPGKVLLPLAGKPALERMIERVRRSNYVDEIAIATTTNRTDDMIVDLARRLSVAVFRGSEENVLGRVVETAKSVAGEIIVELTGDCPLMDAETIDRGIEEYFVTACDVSANVIQRTYADGFDVQVYSTKLLADVAAITNDALDREHVTRYVYRHDGNPYIIRHWKTKDALYWPDLRLTLDERDDWVLINEIFEELLPRKEGFTYKDIITLMRARPDLVTINSHVKPKNI
jgi:spore coat polysaccharide biosynthesis protein SpsF